MPTAGKMMAKSKHRQQPIPKRQAEALPPRSAPSIQLPLGYNPKGPKEPVDVVSSREGWSEFTLTDGTVIRAKAVVLEVKKMTDQYTPDGEPIYELQLTMVNQTRVPDNLKKKG
jgi:hypothetical protein